MRWVWGEMFDVWQVSAVQDAKGEKNGMALRVGRGTLSAGTACP